MSCLANHWNMWLVLGKLSAQASVYIASVWTDQGVLFQTACNVTKVPHTIMLNIIIMSPERCGVLSHWQLNCLLKRCSGWEQLKHYCSQLPTLCGGNPPVISGSPSQRTNDMESNFILWHHETSSSKSKIPTGRVETIPVYKSWLNHSLSKYRNQNIKAPTKWTNHA